MPSISSLRTFGTLTLLAMAGIGCDRQTDAAKPTPPPHVNIATVQQRDVPVLVHAVGTLRANQIARISAQIAGNLTELKFDDGETVKAGDPIALLDSDVQRSAYDASVAAMKTAKFNYENTKQLLAAEASTQFEVDQNLNAYNQAQAEVAERQSVLDKLTLKAPFDGRLSIHMRDEGDYLDQGDSIVTLVDDDPMLVDYRVPEKHVEQLEVGQAVTISPTGAETPLTDADTADDTEAGVTGKVTAIDPQIDRGTRTVLVRASIPNPEGKLISGRFVHVQQTIGELSGALLIPQQAVVLDTKGAAVYLVQADQTVKRVPIQLGEYLGTQVVVTDGLQVDDRVVTRGWQKLHTGAKVKVDETTPASETSSSTSGMPEPDPAKPQAADGAAPSPSAEK